MTKKVVAVAVIVIAVCGFVFWQKGKQKEELFKVMKVPEFSFVNQNGKVITPKSMLGKVYVVEFFFASCPTICPVMNRNLREIEDELNNPDFGAISITIDPKRDTPERLKLHADQLGVKSANWHFLTGDRDEIVQLSQRFNIYVGEDETTAEGLNHSGKFALVDKEGNIRSRYYSNGMPIMFYSGLNYKDPEGKEMALDGTYHPEIEWLKEDMRKLLAEESSN